MRLHKRFCQIAREFPDILEEGGRCASTDHDDNGRRKRRVRGCATNEIMSHSTTATSTYPLAKYSKSYPSTLQKAAESTPEWQHFTNPSIRLVLDVRKGAQLESVRLRIMWSMDSDSDPAQREVVFASRMS